MERINGSSGNEPVSLLGKSILYSSLEWAEGFSSSNL
jgi:hypothetical protein